MAVNRNNSLPGRFRMLDLQIDLDRGTVSRGKQSIELPDLSFRLLAVLLRHAPEQVSKDELIQEVWGDVVVGDETLAQRIRLLRQALGEDGQSPRYFKSVRGRGYRLICDVKPISGREPRKTTSYGLIGLVTISLAVAALWAVNAIRDVPPSPRSASSIAVLPFADLSEDQSYRYFADGMQDELLTSLAAIDGLKVLSRTSVEAYRSTTLSLPRIGEELGVDAIIEGSVRVDDDRIRITVQLIEAQTDEHLWADNFDRTLSVQSIFSIQQEVSRQIALALKLEYAINTAPDPVQLPTGNLDAYSDYLLGRYHTFKQTRDDLHLAVQYLGQATTLDPNFAEAFAALGWAYSFLGTYYGDMLPREAYPKAKEAALKALSLDSGLADARTLYADILTWYDWDFDAAEREYRKTLALDSLNVLGYALFLSTQERHAEAIELVERRLLAQPDSDYVHVNAAWRFLNAGKYERAIEEAELAGNHADAREVMGFAWLAVGNAQRAVSVFESDLEYRGRWPRKLSNLAVAYYGADRVAEGDELLGELEVMAHKQFFSPSLLSTVYFAADEADKGFASLQDAVDAKVRDVIFLRVNESLDPWRNDPRYLELLQSVGLSSPR
jgi:TolB-like protein/DNA-binding winged helix-turn-helix (wHTH) protein